MIMINTFMTSGFGLTQELPHSFRPAFREARAGTSAGVPRETHQLRTVFWGKTMGKPWETHYFWGKLWENYGKTLDNSMIIACFLFFFLDSNWSQSWVPFQRIIGSTFQNSPHHCVAVLQRGMYSISAWFWSKTLGDLPVDVIGPLIGSSLIFAMTGVGKTAESQPCSR
jgi:hypothetical protein